MRTIFNRIRERTASPINDRYMAQPPVRRSHPSNDTGRPFVNKKEPGFFASL